MFNLSIINIQGFRELIH